MNGVARSSTFAAIDLLMNSVQVPHYFLESTNSQGKTEIQVIENRIMRLEVVAAAFYQETRALVVQYRRRRNMLVCNLFQLPTEILSYILNLARSDPGCFRDLHNLRLVSSRFYEVVEATPGLWSHLSRFNSERWIQLQLKKSKHAPLHIEMYPMKYPEDQGNMLRMVATHMHRWESMLYGIESDNKMWFNFKAELGSALSTLASAEAPLLQEFTVKDYSLRHIRISPINLFNGYAPHLRHFDALPITLSWDSPILSGLTFLRVSAWDGTRAPSSDQYVRVLTSCPGLEEVHLQGQIQDCIKSEGADFRVEISLPGLQELTFANIHPVTVGSILSSVKATPKTVGISFPMFLVEEWQQTLDEAFGSLQKSSIVSRTYLSADAIELSGTYGQEARLSAFYKGSDGPTLHFYCYFESLQSPLLLVPSLVSSPALKNLRTLLISSAAETDFEDYTPQQLLEGLPKLEVLHIMEAPSWPKIIMELLSLPPGSSDQEEELEWRCPRLRVFSLCGIMYELKEILAFVRARYQQRCGTHVSVLSELEISCYLWTVDPNTHPEQNIGVEIANIVGKGVFKWEKCHVDESGIWT
ncbi:hypothetical protein FRC02_010574 [Tulasnella sp. 418]|nr:hypothetical protein FRC02_010574 [Tulasnella sp. 418]